MFSRYMLAAGALSVAFAASAAAQTPFTLTSQTFKDGTMMPRKVANKNAQNPNCVGDNVSPQLSWTGVPAGTNSFALLMEDPEGRGGAGVVGLGRAGTGGGEQQGRQHSGDGTG